MGEIMLIEGVQMVASGDRICMSVKEGKPFEPKTLNVWEKVCHDGPEGVMLDIGAYTGLFSIMAAQCGCRAMAFEPLPANQKRIAANARLNGVSKLISLSSCVVSDVDGSMEITVNPNVIGLTSGASLVRKTGVKRTVGSVRVDSLGLTEVKAIKIDVERAEPMVLRGAQETLKKFKPKLFIEVLDKERANEVLDLVPGYKLVAELDKRNWFMVPEKC